MTIHRLESTTFVPRPLPEVWDFFARPANLALLTPPAFRFEFLDGPPERVFPGCVFATRLRPVLGLPITWLTEITALEPESYFVDEQRSGPYRTWHHQHHFRAQPGGTELRDVIHYALPFAPLSELVHDALVAPRLREMMSYRSTALDRLFPAQLATPAAS